MDKVLSAWYGQAYVIFWICLNIHGYLSDCEKKTWVYQRPDNFCTDNSQSSEDAPHQANLWTLTTSSSVTAWWGNMYDGGSGMWPQQYRTNPEWNICSYYSAQNYSAFLLFPFINHFSLLKYLSSPSVRKSLLRMKYMEKVNQLNL